MIYKTVDLSGSLRGKVLLLNRISEEDLDIAKYESKDLETVLSFKEKLLSCQGERFLIVGDYDCDGVSATAIMKRFFDHLGIASNFYIPSRLKEGYGLNLSIVDMAVDHGFTAVLTVDNGVSALDELRSLKRHGLKTFVIDHHEYEEVPEVDGFLHPSLLPEGYRDLCAGGLCALLSSYVYEDDLSMVYGGLATKADMVSVLGYNRYLLKKMLSILNTKHIHPIDLLSGKTSYDYDDLSFSVIPKINAVSRLGYNVNFLVYYLLSDYETCRKTVEQIEKVNRERQNLTRTMSEKAKEKARDEYALMIVKDESFHEGLCGLVANRLLSTYHKPVLVLTRQEGEYRGSGRSIPGFHLYEYLKGFDGFLTFGGHDLAVGLSIQEENYPSFLEYVKTHEAIYEEVTKEVLLLHKEDLNIRDFEAYEDLKPFGTGFEEPLFGFAHPRILKSTLIKDLYPKYSLDGIDAISFKERTLRTEIPLMTGRLQRDRYRRSALSFLIEDFPSISYN